jgi:putative nucleotidyltransferase with HDIG domain
LSKRESIERIANTLDQILSGNYKVCIDKCGNELDQVVERINRLAHDLFSFFLTIKETAQGNFSLDIEGTRGIPAGLKTLQANIRHLIWQCGRIADGDLSIKILPMGTLSEVFNRMITSLRRAREEVTQLNLSLEEKVEERTKKLQRTYMDVIRTLAATIDEKDPYTHNHSKNVAYYATLISKEMHLNEGEIDVIERASLLHDIGKIGIPDYLLAKTENLSPREWEIIREHPIKGAKILEPLEFLVEEIRLIKQHHERFDGEGYPARMKGESICLGARIMAVADAYDAMSKARPYRKAFTKEEMMIEFEKGSGYQFDPQIIDVLKGVMKNSPSKKQQVFSSLFWFTS